MNRDPVCGREVDAVRALYTSEYGGETYCFCSAACKERFDQNPAVDARRRAG